MNGELHPHSEINLPSARRKRRAPNWRQAPRVKPISELLAERQWANRITTIDPSAYARADAWDASTALAEGRWRAAIEFGVPCGWRQSWGGFEIEELCASSQRRHWHIRSKPHEMFDHPTYFRWQRGHAPAAIVAQPYAPAFNLAKAEQFAREHELVVHVADACESWYSPGKCLIVVWKRGYPPRQDRGAFWAGR